MRRVKGAALAGAAVASFPTQASAHLIGVELGGFYAGALHLFSAVDYIAALVGLSVWATLQKPDDRATGALGATLGLGLATWVGTHLGIDSQMLSQGGLIVLGILIALPFMLPAIPLILTMALLAAPLGLSNGAAVSAGGTNVPLFIVGVAVAGGLTVVFGTGLASAAFARLPVAALGMRILGGWLIAFGAISLAVLTLPSNVLN